MANRFHFPQMLVALTAATIALALPAQAEKPSTETLTQVDGITNRVIDKLWEGTDYYWHDGDYNRVVGLIRIIVEADPSFDEAYSCGAWLLWSMGDPKASNELLQHSVKNSPNKWIAHYDFGELLFIRRQWKEALPHFEIATTHKNAPPSAFKMMGHCYEKLGQVEKSAAAWRIVVKRFPEDKAGPPNLRRLEGKLKAKV